MSGILRDFPRENPRLQNRGGCAPRGFTEVNQDENVEMVVINSGDPLTQLFRVAKPGKQESARLAIGKTSDSQHDSFSEVDLSLLPSKAMI